MGTHLPFWGVGTHQYWRILDSCVTHYCTMIDDNQNTRARAHTHTLDDDDYAMVHHIESFVFCCYFRQEVDRKINMSTVPTALASLHSGILQIDFHFFWQLLSLAKNILRIIFEKRVTFCEIDFFFTTIRPLAFQDLAPFVRLNPAVKREKTRF